MTEKNQTEIEGRQREGSITKVKVGESYKKELVRNGLDATERSSRVRTGEAIAGFSYKKLLLWSGVLGTEANCKGYGA